jgi:hypothetical protein
VKAAGGEDEKGKPVHPIVHIREDLMDVRNIGEGPGNQYPGTG